MRVELPVTRGKEGQYRLSPTDVSQFLRLEQCQRYLRLRLHERSGHYNFMRDDGVVPQSLPPLLTRSGADFEVAIERDVAARHPTRDFGTAGRRGGDRDVDNAEVVALARALAPGETLVLFQPRLLAGLDDWLVRGDVDILRLERDDAGTLRVLIADMKSSISAKVEHRLQVAFYHEMLAALLAREGVACAAIETAVLYRRPAMGDAPRDGTEGTEDDKGLSDADAALLRAQRDPADRLFGTREGLLELVLDPESYRGAVRDLVTGPDSTAARVAAAPFDEVPFHLAPKCDGCLYNEFCMKWSARADDLSLLPHVSPQDKSALRRAGVVTTRQLAALKTLVPADEGASDGDGAEGPRDLVPTGGQEGLVRRLGATWPVGPRLDELVHRARRYRRFKGDAIESLSYIPSKGYGSLPYADAGHNPNLVRVYIDAQHDYLEDRVYMLGALVVACEDGVERADRRRAIVHMTDRPPDTSDGEAELFVRWIDETVRAIVELAAPDAEGRPRAPIHLVFYTALVQRLLLDGLGRHAASILGATPFYDFVTQLAAFDSPVSTVLDAEIRELKNYPMVCQSLQSVAAYLRFDWNAPEPYREVFRERLFDYLGKLRVDDGPDAAESWYTRRARFGSQLPLEYAYAAWGALDTPTMSQGAAAVPSDDALDDPPAPTPDDYAPYRRASPELLRGFEGRRLEAMEWIAHDFRGNKWTEKRAFDLPDLARFAERAQTLAQALDEFVTVERHVKLGEWKAARLAPPERRVLAGETLIVRYDPADQEPGIAARNRDNLRRARLKDEAYAAYRAANPGAARVKLDKARKEECDWSQAGMRVRLRVACDGLDCALDEALALTTLREGKRVVVSPRTSVDSRLPAADRKEFTPTPKQMLYRPRADIVGVTIARDAAGNARFAHVEVEFAPARGGSDKNGFVFSAIDEPLVDGGLYTLDEDPNDWYGFFCKEVAKGLCAGERNALYARLADIVALGADAPARWDDTGGDAWPEEAARGQARFMAGLDALQRAGALHPFEDGKRAYIASHGGAPILLVQGPPGTGKSYATAFALFARLQGAMAAGRDLRVFLSCKTHAATDVLLDNVRHVQGLLRGWAATHPDIAAQYLDRRLLEAPLFRVRPRETPPDGVIALPRDDDRALGAPRAVEAIEAARWCVVAAAPAGIRGLLKDRWPKALFGHDLCDLLVLDEASQMNLPEAAMAALPLRSDGRVIVVGDHRQMPPIVMHDWAGEPRRTFQEFRAFESLFLTLLPAGLPTIKFAESFRLHADMAEFLRHEVYRHDGIAYHSRRRETLPPCAHPDPFVAAVLSPAHPIVVVVHDEEGSQVRNPFEGALMAPVLEALAAPPYDLDPEHGLGVVVPHRAQRAALREGIPGLTRVDPATGTVTVSAVDTVERFQGDERQAILVSATESDREYLLVSGEFLLDPRRLTVALSRAKRKMALVASRAVFGLFSPDEETFAHAQLWKNLLRRTCVEPLWSGERDGCHVEVWGNVPTPHGSTPQPEDTASWPGDTALA